MIEELNKTNRLTITVIIIVLVIITGLITFRRPDVKYTLSPAESLNLLNDSALLISPEEALSLLTDSSGKTVFVDVRNSIAFERGHVKGAVNIPVRELFSMENKSFFREAVHSGQTLVMYGETQQQASGPWLMLQQTGIKNAKLYTGNYTQLDPAEADSLSMQLTKCEEIPIIDTAALKSISAPVVTEKNTANQDKLLKKRVNPVKREASSGGGC